MSPFDTMAKRSARFFVVDEEDFASQLRENGWGESAIEQELNNLREYKQRFRLEPPPELNIEEAAQGNEFMAAVLRKRQRRTDTDGA